MNPPRPAQCPHEIDRWNKKSNCGPWNRWTNCLEVDYCVYEKYKGTEIEQLSLFEVDYDM